MENRRKFRLADVILFVICVVFVAEAVFFHADHQHNSAFFLTLPISHRIIEILCK